MPYATGIDRGAPHPYRPVVTTDQQRERDAGVELVCEMLHAKTNCPITLVPHTEIAVRRSSGAIEPWAVCARIDSGTFLACSFDGGRLTAWKILTRDDIQSLNPGFTEPKGGSWVSAEKLRKTAPSPSEMLVLPQASTPDYTHFHSLEGRSAFIQLVVPRVVAHIEQAHPGVIDPLSDHASKNAMDRELARAALAYARSIGRALKGEVPELQIVERIGTEYSSLFADLTRVVQRGFLELRITEAHRHGSVLHSAFDTLGRALAGELKNRPRSPFGAERSLPAAWLQEVTDRQTARVEKSFPGFEQARRVMGSDVFARHLGFALGRHAEPGTVPAWMSWSLKAGGSADRNMQ